MKKINLEQIEAKKNIFASAIEKEVENKKKGNSPVQQFLGSLENEIKTGISNGLSYTQLSKIIHNTFSISISPATIRAFAVNHLKIEKKVRNVNKVIDNSSSKNEDFNNNSSENNNSVLSMKKIQNSKNSDF